MTSWSTSTQNLTKVHLFVAYRTTLAISVLVQPLKGRTAEAVHCQYTRA